MVLLWQEVQLAFYLFELNQYFQLLQLYFFIFFLKHKYLYLYLSEECL